MIPFSCRYESCSWGVSPGNALVVSSAMDVKERKAVQNFLGAAVGKYGGREVVARRQNGRITLLDPWLDHSDPKAGDLRRINKIQDPRA